MNNVYKVDLIKLSAGFII